MSSCWPIVDAIQSHLYTWWEISRHLIRFKGRLLLHNLILGKWQEIGETVMLSKIWNHFNKGVFSFLMSLQDYFGLKKKTLNKATSFLTYGSLWLAMYAPFNESIFDWGYKFLPRRGASKVVDLEHLLSVGTTLCHVRISEKHRRRGWMPKMNEINDAGFLCLKGE